MRKQQPGYLPEHIHALLIKQTNATLTAAEDQQLQRWYDSLAFTPERDVLDNGPEEATEKQLIWEGITARRKQPRMKIFSLNTWMKRGAAAAVVFLLAAGSWVYLRNSNPYQLQLATSTGKVQQLTLPDGSRVWLNASSELQYNNWQPGKPREVMLKGEAFFEVAQRSSEPFIIHTHTVDIRVLGTSFNVKAYADDAHTETTLVEGKVAVTLKKENNRTVQLTPSQKLVVYNKPAKATEIKPVHQRIHDTVSYSIQPVHPISGDSNLAEAAWRERRLVFFDQSFEDIAAALHRWYGVTVIFNEVTMKKARFTGNFRDEALPRVMMALQLSSPFNYYISNDTLMINK
ncbi:FecR family protein [Chitinophaga solisilvae]|uniref:FecR family protein n=1 Tax=Chitinophaga solisilvae TaxID=1233460 RepID=A0A433WCW2_9BACT|nr:FecR family protein [Chitinophaga solisilvae]NSL89751.1 FecR family protein [Chitinophaga solisilvae]